MPTIANNKTVVPLNGWRMRRLAKHFGKTEDIFLDPDFTCKVPAYVIQSLPGFDVANTNYVNQFHGDVKIAVEAYIRSYGCHISIEQL